MKVKEIVKAMEKANEFASIVKGHIYEVRSELTGVQVTYNDFIKAVKEEFVDPDAVLNADVQMLYEGGVGGKMKGIYEFDGEPMEFEFTICVHLRDSFSD